MRPEEKSGDEDGLHFVTSFSLKYYHSWERWRMKTMSTVRKMTKVSSMSTSENQVHCLNISIQCHSSNFPNPPKHVIFFSYNNSETSCDNLLCY